MDQTIIEFFLKNEHSCRFLMDSGAFTAWKTGQKINLDDYCKYIENLPIKPWRYFSLDVIGDPDLTMKNYQIMISRGFNPIPIFTRGDDLSVIDEYYKTSDIIGVGGLVGTQNNKGFVKGLMKHIGDRKVHWLGFTNRNFIKFYRPFMCDSSSWSTGVRYGMSSLFFPPNKWIKFNKNSNLSEISEYIKYYGFDPLLFKNKKSWINSGAGNNANEVVNMRSFILYQKFIFDNYKTLYFLACSRNWQLQLFLDAFNYWKNRGLIK
jgi:hypothetical protein